MSYDATSRPAAVHRRYEPPDERLAAALAENERLRAALERIANQYSGIRDESWGIPGTLCAALCAARRIARAVLAATDSEAGGQL